MGGSFLAVALHAHGLEGPDGRMRQTAGREYAKFFHQAVLLLQFCLSKREAGHSLWPRRQTLCPGIILLLSSSCPPCPFSGVQLPAGLQTLSSCCAVFAFFLGVLFLTFSSPPVVLLLSPDCPRLPESLQTLSSCPPVVVCFFRVLVLLLSAFLLPFVLFLSCCSLYCPCMHND